MNKIEKAILQTLVFFDIFKRPLTLEELWRFLYKIKAGKLQVLMGLRKLEENQKIYKKNIFYRRENRYYYALSGSQNIFKIFEDNRLVQRRNWHKVEWVAKILRFAPYIKNLSVINSLSFSASGENSDIDILIISHKNRLWTTRALVVFLLEIFGQNKNKWYQSGKFCLGFAFDETCLNLKNLRLKNDIYFTYWLANLEPVLDRNIYQKLIEENVWIYDDLPNWTPKYADITKKSPSFWEKLLAGRLGDKLERWLEKIQVQRVWSDPKNIGADEVSVIASSHMLKLHPYDKRSQYQDQWFTKYQNFVNIKSRLK